MVWIVWLALSGWYAGGLVRRGGREKGVRIRKLSDNEEITSKSDEPLAGREKA